MARGRFWCLANKSRNRNATIWGPRWPGAGSGAIANKNRNRNAIIWGPRKARAGSGAIGNQIPHRNATIWKPRAKKTFQEGTEQANDRENLW